MNLTAIISWFRPISHIRVVLKILVSVKVSDKT